MSSHSRVSLTRIGICFLWSFLLLLVVLCFLFSLCLLVRIIRFRTAFYYMCLAVCMLFLSLGFRRVSQSILETFALFFLSLSLLNAARKRIFYFLLPEVSFWKFWIWHLSSSRCC
jgi:hypothetical protein